MPVPHKSAHIVLDEDYRPLAEQRLAGHRLVFFPATIDSEHRFADLIRTADILVLRRSLSFRLSRATLEDAHNLRYIQKSGSGMDWFDLDMLRERGIVLTLNTGLNAGVVAEHALALTLAVSRRMIDYAGLMRGGGWSTTLDGALGSTISGKRVGMIGCGRIGSAYAHMVQALDAEVVAYHPDPDKTMPPGVHWMAFDELVSTSDVVALHTPLTPQTRHMIGKRELGLMKPAAILINTSRGALVEEAAMIAALETGRIRGAGLDVFENSVLAANHPLRSLPNAVLTPHIGGSTIEIETRQVQASIKNVERYLAGEPPLNAVT